MSVSLMIWWGVKDSLSGYMTPGLLLEFSTFISMMYRPIRQMADNFNVLQMGMVNADRVFKVFDTDESSLDPIPTSNVHIKSILSCLKHKRYSNFYKFFIAN